MERPQRPVWHGRPIVIQEQAGRSISALCTTSFSLAEWGAKHDELDPADDGLRIRKSEHPVLMRPLGGGTAQTSNSNAARQTAFDGGLDQIGCEKGERDRHVD